MNYDKLIIFHYPCTDWISWFVSYCIMNNINIKNIKILNYDNWKNDKLLILKYKNIIFIWTIPSVDDIYETKEIKEILNSYWLSTNKINEIIEIDIMTTKFIGFLNESGKVNIFDHHEWNKQKINNILLNSKKIKDVEIKIVFNKNTCWTKVYLDYIKWNIKLYKSVIDLICKADTYTFDVNNKKELLNVLSFSSFIDNFWNTNSSQELINNFELLKDLFLNWKTSKLYKKYIKFFNFYKQKIEYYENNLINDKIIKIINIEWIKIPVIFLTATEFNDLTTYILNKFNIKIFAFLNISILPTWENIFTFSVRAKKWSWKALELIKKLSNKFPEYIKWWWHSDAWWMSINFELLKQKKIKFEYFK